MKRALFSFVLLFVALLSYAQVSDSVTWIEEEDNFVITQPKTTIYALPGNVTFYTWRVIYNGERAQVNYDDFKTKKVKKPQRLVVRGFANRHKQLEYDTYVVEYKEKLYFLPRVGVEDNSIIDSVNAALTAEYKLLTEGVRATKYELDSLVAKYSDECERQIVYLSNLKETLPMVIDSVRQKAKADYKALEEQEYQAWYNTLPKSTQRAFSKLAITEAQLSSPNSAAGCDYTFAYVNNSDKTIKYLYWDGVFYNAVDDVVYCEIRDFCSFRGKDTGPVAPGESGGGVWDCVIYNWSADYVKLSSVKIVYMDGTSTTIGASDIRRLLTMPSSWDFYEKYGSEYDAETKAVAPYTRQLNGAGAEIRTWEARLNYLKAGRYKYPLLYENEEYQAVFDRISALFNEHSDLCAKLSTFENSNVRWIAE